MNVERHMNRVNRLLESELGQHPLYRWIHSESSEFRRAMRVVDVDGKPEWDYLCPCGKNVNVHSAECVAGKLVIAEPKFEVRKIDQDMVDSWVLCARIEPPSRDEWVKAFGTKLPYPANGTWAPVATETYTVAAPRGTLPGENFTMAIIRARQHTRAQNIKTLENDWEWRKERDREKKKDDAAYRLKDCFTWNPKWGTRSGGVSWGGIGESPAVNKGESVVTL